MENKLLGNNVDYGTKPKTKRGEATRKKILQAAADEIGGKGFSEASISSITTAAGVGQGTFYIYFKSKEEVLRALVQEYSTSIRHHLSEASKGASSRLERERLGLKAFIDYVRENRSFYLIIHETMFIDPELYQEYYQQFANSYERRLDDAQKNNEIEPLNTEVCAWSLMGIGEFLGYRYGILDTKTPSEKVVEDVFTFIENGMRKK
ncbi:MAG: TetR/AcrR family transcriptional regulator [Agarilytica sp.]